MPTPKHPVALRRRDMLMTQAELAKRSGLCLRTICSIERGRPCRMDTKRKILAALSIDFADRSLVFPHALSS